MVTTIKKYKQIYSFYETALSIMIVIVISVFKKILNFIAILCSEIINIINIDTIIL